MILVTEDGPNWRVRFRERYWSFPRDECVLLPVANTTAERLADVIGSRLRDAIAAKPMNLPRVMRVEVEECFGQWAISEWRREEP